MTQALEEEVSHLVFLYAMCIQTWWHQKLRSSALTESVGSVHAAAAPCADILFSLTCKHKETQTQDVEDEPETKLIL